MIPPHNNPNSPDQSCCEIAHAILIGRAGPLQGKVLLIQGNGEGTRWIWDPAAPSSVSSESACDNVPDNLFCSAHSADADGDLIVHGGNRYIACEHPDWSWVFDPVERCWDNRATLVKPTTPSNLGFYFQGLWLDGVYAWELG